MMISNFFIDFLQCSDTVSWATRMASLSLRFNGHFSGEPGLAGVYWSKGWWKWCLSQAHLGVFQLCLWPLIVPGYLGEGCHASHQPSDASNPSDIRPVKSLVLVWWWWRFDWSFACLTSPIVTNSSITLSSSKNRLTPVNPGPPGKTAVKTEKLFFISENIYISS